MKQFFQNHFRAAWLCLVVLLLPALAPAACFTVPMMQGQDPQVEVKDGTFHLVQSDGCNVRLRKSTTLGGLASAANPIIVSPGCSNVWAPEIHWFSNKWYVYYSLGNDSGDAAYTHRVYVAESQGTNASGPYTIRGVLLSSYWNIDGSVFAATNGALYFIFSGSPSGTQNIYIAPMSNPYTLGGAPVLISQPNQSWETIGTPPSVNEGPFGFTRNGRTFIVYSASGCWTDDYCLGLLTLSGTNLLDAPSWGKTGPVFSKQAGAYGPGHNAVFTDANGQWWNIYHANNLTGQGCGGYRQLRLQRLAWDANNLPVFGAPVPLGSWITDDTNFLAAQFLLNESGGATAFNQTCSPSGTLIGAPMWMNPGLKLNGTNDYVIGTTNTANDVQTALTLSAWVKPEGFVDWGGIITKGTNAAAYAMQVWSDGSLRFTANWGTPPGSLNSGSWNSATKLTTNQWQHVAVTYDGTKIRFFINGVLDALQPTMPLRFGVVNEPLTIGADLPGGDEFFKGTIADARVYGRALGTNEIQSLASTVPQPTLTPVDPNFAVVTNFEGWGTSLCWWPNVVGGYANRDTYASLAFSTLKLNIVRYDIGGGENPSLANTMEYRAQMPGFAPTNGVWNWSADANQRWMLQRAVALGAKRVVAFANSPPWWMTVSGSVTGSSGGTNNNLQVGYEDAFAGYLATVVSNLTVLDGIHFDYVTPMNEPTGNWWTLGGRQEGCHMSADQQARMVTKLRAALDAQNLSAGIHASEDNDEQSAINSLNAYGTAQSNVTVIASHTYGANNPAGLQALGASLHKPVWISEYGDGDGTGMTMARRIHDDLATVWVRAWIYWQVVDNSGGWGFLYNALDGSGNTAYTINKKFYVMGQFSQFIRPGMAILNVGDTNSLAAYSPSNRTLVIAVVNDGSNAFTATYDLSLFGALPVSAAATRTSATESLSALAAINVVSNRLSALLPAKSVTTLVLTNVTLVTNKAAPTAWYQFENNTQDASGNGWHGTNFGATFVAGKLGASAAQFNGSSSYIAIPRSISNHFTISFWLKTTDTGGTGQWWAGRGLLDGEISGTTNDFGMSLTGGKISLGIGNTDTTVTTTNTLNNGLWHHVAATRDAVTGEQRVYVDGSLQASGFGPPGTRGTPTVLRLGSLQTGASGGFLNGVLDDVQIFSRVFAAGEISQLMNHPPQITSAPGSYSLLAGRTLTLTNTASDPDQPAQTLSWNLLSPPAGAAVNVGNGIFSWRPGIAQGPSTNLIRLFVTDNGTPAMSATQSFSVTVLSPQLPGMGATTFSNGLFSFVITGDAGPDYIVETRTNFSGGESWRPVATNNPGLLPFTWTDLNATGSSQKFYRVRLAP